MSKKEKMQFSAVALKNELWDNMQKLKSKKIDTKTANSVAIQSREILRIVKAEVEIARLNNVKPDSKLLEVSK